MTGPLAKETIDNIVKQVSMLPTINAAEKSLIDLNLKSYEYSFEEMYEHYVLRNKNATLGRAIKSWSQVHPLSKTRLRIVNMPKQKQVKLSELVLNEIEQRELSVKWASIIIDNKNFDPRQVSTIDCAYDPKTKKYYVYEGQHTAFALMVLWKQGQLPPDYTVNISYIETSDPMVRRNLTESKNGTGRQSWTAYDYWRNSVYAVHYDNATEPIHIIRYKKQLLLNKYNCYVLDDVLHKSIIKNLDTKQGLVTHIDGLNKISLKSLEKALKWHTKFFKGDPVHSVLLFMFINWEEMEKEYNFSLTPKLLDELGSMLVTKYGNIEKYSKSLTAPIKKWNKKCGEPERNASANDKIGLPFVMYQALGGTEYVPSMIINSYAGTNSGGTLMESMGIKKQEYLVMLN